MSYNFNPKIDHDFLYSMYEDDYGYIAEVFQTTLTQMTPDVIALREKFEQDDLEGVRRLVHKIKPAFGFVGLRATESMCQQFESLCQSAPATAAIAGRFELLIDTLKESEIIIRSEIEKLNAYKASS